jgi:hypothetical protein
MKRTKKEPNREADERNRAATGRPTEPSVPGAPVWPDPQPEQRPWRTKEDAEGWEVVYRGRGQRRRVRRHLLVELTHEQDSWLAKTAAAAHITTAELLRRLVDQARETERGQRPAEELAGLTAAAIKHGDR